MAPQAPEMAQSAPGNNAAPNSSDEAFASVADPSQAPSAPDASQIERPEMAPQAIGIPRFAIQNGVPPEAPLAAEAAPPPPAIAANVLIPPYARRQPGPTAFTGFIRCAG